MDNYYFYNGSLITAISYVPAVLCLALVRVDAPSVHPEHLLPLRPVVAILAAETVQF